LFLYLADGAQAVAAGMTTAAVNEGMFLKPRLASPYLQTNARVFVMQVLQH